MVAAPQRAPRVHEDAVPRERDAVAHRRRTAHVIDGEGPADTNDTFIPAGGTMDSRNGSILKSCLNLYMFDMTQEDLG